MHNLRPNPAAHNDAILRGAHAFATGKGICENPLEAEAGKAWEVGWFNELQAWLMLAAGINNKAGDLFQARIAILRIEVGGEDEGEAAA